MRRFNVFNPLSLIVIILLGLPLSYAQSFDLTGLWHDNTTGSSTTYRIRQIGNAVYWSVDGTAVGSYANVFFGEISGNTLTGTWVDLPSSPALGGGNLTLQIKSNDWFVKTGENPCCYAAQEWVRQGTTGSNVRGNLIGTWTIKCCNDSLVWEALNITNQDGDTFAGSFTGEHLGGDVTNGRVRGNMIEFVRSGGWGKQVWTAELVNDGGGLRMMNGVWTGDFLDQFQGRNNWHAEKK
jgi:hypothetical protein